VRQNLPRTLSGTSSVPDKLNLIKLAIEGLRPHLQRDGGDCELVDVDGNTVFVKLSGSCVGCQLASVTLSGVQDRLVEKLGMPLRVMPVQ
jgi:NifU-like protein